MIEGQSALAGKKILIVEDDPLLHNLLGDKLAHLKEKGVESYPMTRAEDALVKAREVKPDLVLLDLVLPGMSGFEFLEALRKEEGLAKTPVVILSNLSAESDKERARKLGVVAYLVKADFSLNELSDAAEELLSGKPIGSHENKEAVGIEKTSKGYMVHL